MLIRKYKEKFVHEKHVFPDSNCAFGDIYFSPKTLVQNSPQWHLPEGVKAGLGKGRINEIQHSPDGTRMAVASGTGIWLYDAWTGEERDLLIGHTSVVSSISYSPDGRTLACGVRFS